jgi:hypothetical protein
MSISYDQIVSKVLNYLAPEELSQSIVYITKTLIPAGRIEFPRISIDVPWSAYIAFVDQEPAANWSHSSRYLLISGETGEIKSFEAQFPPFHGDQRIAWSLLYKAPSVPNEFVMDTDEGRNSQ